MANPKIIPKKSTVSGKVPTSADLNLGEFAVNSPDRKIYYRQPETGTVVTLGGESGAPISATSPANPSAGALWIEESTLRAFVYYDNAWVEIVGQKGDKGDKGDTGASGASTWADIAGKPSTFTPSSHTHTVADVTGAIAKNAADSSPVSTIRCLTQAEYNALGTYDSQTLYFIK